MTCDTVQETGVTIQRQTGKGLHIFVGDLGGGDVLAGGQVAGAGHGQRHGHILLDGIVQRHVEYLFHQIAQQNVPHGGLLHLGTGLVFQRAGQQSAQRIFCAAGFMLQ